MPTPDLLDRTVLHELLAPLGITPASDPEPAGSNYGFASQLAALHVTLANGSEAAVVVKVWDSRTHGLGEIEFYENWAPRLPIRLATHHGSHATEEMGLLVLEDLRPVRQGDEELGMALADACSVARTIAAVHLATVGAESSLEPTPSSRPAEWHDSRRVSFIKRFGMPDHGLVRSIVVNSELAERLGRSLVSEAAAGLVHADLHADNIVFVADDPIILDWSRPRWGPAVEDLASLLVSVVSPEDYDAVINAYRDKVAIDDDQITGGILTRLLVGTLGVARWIPSTPRQERLITLGQRRVEQTAEWLAARAPGIEPLLRG